jgi:hypothetical protein
MDANIKIIDDLKNFIGECCTNGELRSLFTTSKTDFTRERKLNFERLVLLLINFFKKSYNIEIAEFYNRVSPESQPVSKSAFCQQRMKIKGVFFTCLNEILVQSFYTHYEHRLKRWHGMRLIAIDGTTVYLFDNEDVTSHFGTQKGHSNVPMGQALSAFDVLNGITIRSGLYPIKMAEQKIARQWLENYDQDMLLIYDRGYPGFTSIFLHENKEQAQPFLMRCQADFTRDIKSFVASDSNDSLSVFRAGKKASEELYRQGFVVPVGATVQVRLIKVVLDNGTIEVLATNLFNTDEYPHEVFKELYFKRWGIETNYNTIKNQLQLEAFSGQKVTTILQDFYITFFLSNLQYIISKPVDYELSISKNKKKYQYKVNRNIAFGIMKNRIIDLFMAHAPDQTLTLLQQLFSRYLEPIRPNRNYPRRKKFARINGKFQPLNNFKRAI